MGIGGLDVLKPDSGTELTELEQHFAEEMRNSHYVSPADNQDIWDALGGGRYVTSQDVVDHARTHGIEVLALCGYRWVPQHDPQKYPVCEACVDEAERRVREEG